MNKYLDAEKLKEHISRLRDEFMKKSETKGYTTLEYRHKAEGLSLALQHIDSLQQEQPQGHDEAAEENFETMEVLEHENIFEETHHKIFKPEQSGWRGKALRRRQLSEWQQRI